MGKAKAWRPTMDDRSVGRAPTGVDGISRSVQGLLEVM
ncbi:hypothetical protein BJ965_004576 [Streptomyces luteogriseus]|uniref:Uncharacterized protein n=1 Tax=Streptomyces luteogriseus TaxID=68233 RepID=A0A7W7GIV1_9ACTN|nr:hypothetical protein [Streptomyces luteogriseus]